MVNTHPFFKFKTAAKDNGREILDYYRSLTFEEKEDYKYTVEELINRIMSEANNIIDQKLKVLA